MMSRGRMLVNLALTNNNDKRDSKTVSDENSIQTRKSDKESLTKGLVNDLFLIQGSSVTNVENLLYCNEDLNSNDTETQNDRHKTCTKSELPTFRSDPMLSGTNRDDNTTVNEIESRSNSLSLLSKQIDDNNNSDATASIAKKRSFDSMEGQQMDKGTIDIQNVEHGHEISSDDDYDMSDDSVKDPDWSMKKSGRKHVDSSSDETSDDDVERARRREQTRNQEEDIANNMIVHHEEVVSDNILVHTEQAPQERKQRARKGMGRSEDWTRNVNKRLRMEGKCYKGVAKVDGKKAHCIQRSERIQCERKCTKRCKNTRKCHEISGELRKDIFKAFWDRMTLVEKKSYVMNLVNRCESQRSKGDGRRKFTYKYHFRNGDGKVPVCKDFFLTTLGIGEYTVYEWLKKVDTHGLPIESQSSPVPTRQAFDDQSVRDFFEMLPKMPSHYCRSTSTKIYLEPVFTRFADLYRVYKEYCSEKRVKEVSRSFFKRVFDKMNLAIFRPKKDQCDVCVGYETKNVSEEDYTLHRKRREDARAAKERDKQTALETNTVKVITMDLQSVLLCPKLEASAMYYRTKLTCHNFTVYNLGTKRVKCYFWHEGEGGLTANSFASCLDNYITDIVDEDTSEVIFYSDGCGYQNRNSTLANMFLRRAVINNLTITQNYLEKAIRK